MLACMYSANCTLVRALASGVLKQGYMSITSITCFPRESHKCVLVELFCFVVRSLEDSSTSHGGF